MKNERNKLEEHSTTPFSNKVDILSDIWMNYRTDREFQDFVQYNDLGLPLAYLLSAELVQTIGEGSNFIEETWDILLSALDIEDTGYETLNDMFHAVDDTEED